MDFQSAYPAMHASCWSCPSSHLAQDGLCWLVLTKLSSSSLILRSLPAAMMVFMSGVTATPLRAEKRAGTAGTGVERSQCADVVVLLGHCMSCLRHLDAEPTQLCILLEASGLRSMSFLLARCQTQCVNLLHAMTSQEHHLPACSHMPPAPL